MAVELVLSIIERLSKITCDEYLICDEHLMVTRIPHVQQKFHWDCGLACLEMILVHFGKDCDSFRTGYQQFDFGHSVWTIDLANILCKYGIKHCFTSITMGVQKEYSNKDFYKKHFGKDEKRVCELFENSKKCGINVQNKSLKISELIEHLKTNSCFIALVDVILLPCKICKPEQSQICFTFMAKFVDQYQGHFIVVCGYNAKRRLVYYANPSGGSTLCCCTYGAFNSARRAFGTDEDILLIFDDQEGSGAKCSGSSTQPPQLVSQQAPQQAPTPAHEPPQLLQQAPPLTHSPPLVPQQSSTPPAPPPAPLPASTHATPQIRHKHSNHLKHQHHQHHQHKLPH